MAAAIAFLAERREHLATETTASLRKREKDSLRFLCTFVSVVVLAAGVLYGWLDAKGKKPRDLLALLAEKSGPAEGETTRQEAGAEPPSKPATEPARPSEGEETADEAAPPTPEQEERLRAIEAILREQDFPRAVREARRLTRDAEGTVRERARQLEAKALSFEALLPASSKPPTVSRLLLSNGKSVTALNVVERADSYEVTLANGVTYFPRRQDVKKVESVETSEFLKEQWKKMAPRIVQLDHPIDVYVRGVRKLYQVGLRDEGYRLMEKLLEMPGSENVALAFGGDNVEEVLRLWKQAVGKTAEKVPDSKEEAPTEVATPVPPIEANPPVEPNPSSLAKSGPTTPPPVAREPAGFESARQLMNEASALYGAAVGKEGRQDDIRQAYDKLRDAQEILERLPPSDATRGLNRSLAQLIVDVGKSLPFY